jgi:hypothetical protein
MIASCALIAGVALLTVVAGQLDSLNVRFGV